MFPFLILYLSDEIVNSSGVGGVGSSFFSILKIILASLAVIVFVPSLASTFFTLNPVVTPVVTLFLTFTVTVIISPDFT